MPEKKGRKQARFGLIPPIAERELAEQFGHGAGKYDNPRSWEDGDDWSVYYDALRRHLNSFWGGEDFDEEARPHLAAAAFNVAVLQVYYHKYPGLDDRSKL